MSASDDYTVIEYPLPLDGDGGRWVTVTAPSNLTLAEARRVYDMLRTTCVDFDPTAATEVRVLEVTT